jgi:16S rRNA (guanine966-N2)-methyltransferase
MRIIAGRFRSRKLKTPEGMEVRPTSDRLRETLFNILAPQIEGARFLDLFAGTGAVGLEALSRGAREAVLVEANKRAARTIRDNISLLDIADVTLVVEQEAAKALRTLNGQFELVFLDPPYSLHGQYDQCLKGLAASALLTPESIVIAEHDKRFTPAECYGDLQCYRRLLQGDAGLSFYRATSSQQ